MPEEKPITVDRPNRTYVFYLASEMKFDETLAKRATRHAYTLAHEIKRCVISGGTKQTSSMGIELAPLGV